MDYSKTLHYLYSRLPMFTRIGAAALKKDLTNTLELLKRINNPEKRFKSIHIAGTNGKGSTSHMLAAILQTAGYKTGLYTSPHLLDFRERIRINGQMIPQKDVVDFVAGQIQNIEEIEPSFFELTVAMAFDHFSKNKVDIAIIETGLGGRLDSTNVIKPLLSVITNIGYDHMDLLGHTLLEIAAEKAGIIKPAVPVIIGEKQPETEHVFLSKAKECNSPIHFASDDWEIEQVRPESAENKAIANQSQHLTLNVNRSFSLQLDLKGSYQIKNLATVLSTVVQLRKLGWKIGDQHLQSALAQVTSITGLMGRWQTIHTNPLVICDTGHNEDGIREVLKNICSTPHEKLHMVIGMVKDKDIHKILAMLPVKARYYFCSPAMERAKPATELAEEATHFELSGKAYKDVKSALKAAKEQAGKNDLIFVGGSTFVVAEAL